MKKTFNTITSNFIQIQDVPFEFTHQSEVQIDDNCLYYINNNKNNFVLYLD